MNNCIYKSVLKEITKCELFLPFFLLKRDEKSIHKNMQILTCVPH